MKAKMLDVLQKTVTADRLPPPSPPFTSPKHSMLHACYLLGLYTFRPDPGAFDLPVPAAGRTGVFNSLA